MKRQPLLLTALTLAMATFLTGCPDRPDDSSGAQDSAQHKVQKRIAEVSPSLKNTKKAKEKQAKKKLSKKELRRQRKKMLRQRVALVQRALDQIDETLPENEKPISRGLKDALAAEDFSAVTKFANQARTATSKEVRGQAVEALGWFGKRAIADLTPFMGDADPEVADDAQRAWEQALSEIDDDTVKLEYLNTVMSTMNEREMLDAVAMNYHSVADEAAAVESLIGIIGQGGTAGEVAKETYEFITGEEWKSRDAALTWAANQRKEAAEAELE